MDTLGLFVKHPQAGHVKTRLGGVIGEQEAAALYAAFVSDVVNRHRQTARRRVLCYAPDSAPAAAYFAGLAGDDYELWPQPALTLGGRMAGFFAHAFARGARRVVIIGTDSPTLPGAMIDEAFARLEDRDCVLGPATDGGFYLVGQRHESRAIFDGVDWSTSRVLEQTAARIQRRGATLALLPPWYDVDTADDLQMLRGHLQALQSAGELRDLPATAACLHDILAR